jgi:hypothetical protein
MGETFAKIYAQAFLEKGTSGRERTYPERVENE